MVVGDRLELRRGEIAEAAVAAAAVVEGLDVVEDLGRLSRSPWNFAVADPVISERLRA
jgi:hypothetical protein